MQLNGMEFCVLWLTVQRVNFHKFFRLVPPMSLLSWIVRGNCITIRWILRRGFTSHRCKNQNPPLIPLMLPYLTFYYCPGFCYHDHYCLNHPHISLHCFLKVPSTTWIFLTLIPTIFAICCPNILPLLITAVNSFILITSLLLISFLWVFSFNYFKLYYTHMHTQARIEMYVFMF